MSEPCLIIICKDDEPNHDSYVLATRRTFTNRTEAVVYAAEINEKREPLIVECPKGLRY